MTEHANHMDDRVDLGHRTYLAGVFTPIALGSVMAIAGYGLTGSPWIPLAAIVNLVLLMWAGQAIYAGDRRCERIVWIVGAVLLLVGLGIAFSGRNLASFHLAFQLAMPMLFALTLAIPQVHAFLAYRRGESPTAAPALSEAPAVSEPVAAPMESIFDVSPTGLVLREDARQAAGAYARLLTTVAAVFVLGGVVGAGLAIYSLITRGFGVTMILAAVLAIPVGVVMLTLAEDWNLLATSRGREKAHLANILKSSQMLRNFSIALVSVLATLTMLEVITR